MFLNKDAPHFVLKDEPDIVTSIQDDVKELPEATYVLDDLMERVMNAEQKLVDHKKQNLERQ